MTTDLNKKRQKYLILTFGFQILTAISSLVVDRLVMKGSLPIPIPMFVTVHLLILLGVHYFAFYTTCLYFNKRSYKILYGILVFGGFVLGFLAELPFLKSEYSGKVIFTLSAICLLTSMLIWFVVIVKDIFLEAHDLTYRILGAANIYWLLVVVFAYTYCLYELAFVGSIGAPIVSSPDLLHYSFKLSLHTMVSIDHPFKDISLPLENLTLIQATISHLFIVFLVGRLLTK